MPGRQRGRQGQATGESEIDVRAVLGCTCMHLRRTTRCVTQLYDRRLAPVGITAGQFGLLARLYGAKLRGEDALSIGALADQHGMDPTTLNRNLKPLLSAGLVHDGHDPTDRRVRTVSLTDAGRQRLAGAMPLWREAQQRVEAALGAEATLALNGLLDLSATKLTT
jgi:DNA-binding MarR family transcriptional regulator